MLINERDLASWTTERDSLLAQLPDAQRLRGPFAGRAALVVAGVGEAALDAMQLERIAPAAIQSGRAAARNILEDLGLRLGRRVEPLHAQEIGRAAWRERV